MSNTIDDDRVHMRMLNSNPILVAESRSLGIVLDPDGTSPANATFALRHGFLPFLTMKEVGDGNQSTLIYSGSSNNDFTFLSLGTTGVEKVRISTQDTKIRTNVSIQSNLLVNDNIVVLNGAVHASRYDNLIDDFVTHSIILPPTANALATAFTTLSNLIITYANNIDSNSALVKNHNDDESLQMGSIACTDITTGSFSAFTYCNLQTDFRQKYIDQPASSFALNAAYVQLSNYVQTQLASTVTMIDSLTSVYYGSGLVNNESNASVNANTGNWYSDMWLTTALDEQDRIFFTSYGGTKFRSYTAHAVVNDGNNVLNDFEWLDASYKPIMTLTQRDGLVLNNGSISVACNVDINGSIGIGDSMVVDGSLELGSNCRIGGSLEVVRSSGMFGGSLSCAKTLTVGENVIIDGSIVAAGYCNLPIATDTEVGMILVSHTRTGDSNKAASGALFALIESNVEGQLFNQQALIAEALYAAYLASNVAASASNLANEYTLTRHYSSNNLTTGLSLTSVSKESTSGVAAELINDTGKGLQIKLFSSTDMNTASIVNEAGGVIKMHTLDEKNAPSILSIGPTISIDPGFGFARSFPENMMTSPWYASLNDASLTYAQRPVHLAISEYIEYIATASSTFSTDDWAQAYQAFSELPSSTSWISDTHTYSVTTGVPVGTVSTAIISVENTSIVVIGEWIQIDISVPMYIHSFFLHASDINSLPDDFVLVGRDSTSGEWMQLADFQFQAGLVSQDAGKWYAIDQSAFNNLKDTVYNSFRLIVTRIAPRSRSPRLVYSNFVQVDTVRFRGGMVPSSSDLIFAVDEDSLVVHRTGFIGINNENPSALLHFGNAIAPRTLVLYDKNPQAPNDHEFCGLSVLPNGIGIHVDEPHKHMSFIVGQCNTDRAEVFRVDGARVTCFNDMVFKNELYHNENMILSSNGDLHVKGLFVGDDMISMSKSTTSLLLQSGRVEIRDSNARLYFGTSNSIGLSTSTKYGNISFAQGNEESLIIDNFTQSLIWEGGTLGTYTTPWNEAYIGSCVKLGTTSQSGFTTFSMRSINDLVMNNDRSVLTTLSTNIEEVNVDEHILARTVVKRLNDISSRNFTNLVVSSSMETEPEISISQNTIRIRDRTLHFEYIPEMHDEMLFLRQDARTLFIAVKITGNGSQATRDFLSSTKFKVLVSHMHTSVFETTDEVDINSAIMTSTIVLTLLFKFDLTTNRVVSYTLFHGLDMMHSNAPHAPVMSELKRMHWDSGRNHLMMQFDATLLVSDTTRDCFDIEYLDRYSDINIVRNISINVFKLDMVVNRERNEGGGYNAYVLLSYRPTIDSSSSFEGEFITIPWILQLSGPGTLKTSVPQLASTILLLAESGYGMYNAWTMHDLSNQVEIMNACLLPHNEFPQSSRSVIASMTESTGSIIWMRKVLGVVTGSFIGYALSFQYLNTIRPSYIGVYDETDRLIWAETLPSPNAISMNMDPDPFVVVTTSSQCWTLMSFSPIDGKIRSFVNFLLSYGGNVFAREHPISVDATGLAMMIMFDLSGALGAAISIFSQRNIQKTYYSDNSATAARSDTLIAFSFEQETGATLWSNTITLDGVSIVSKSLLIIDNNACKMMLMTSFRDAHPLACVHMTDAFGVRRTMSLSLGFVGNGSSLSSHLYTWYGIASIKLVGLESAFAVQPITHSSLTNMEFGIRDTVDGLIVSPSHSGSRALVLDGGLSGMLIMRADTDIVLNSPCTILRGESRFEGTSVFMCPLVRFNAKTCMDGPSTFAQDITVLGGANFMDIVTINDSPLRFSGTIEAFSPENATKMSGKIIGLRGIETVADGSLLIGSRTSNMIIPNLKMTSDMTEYYYSTQQSNIAHVDSLRGLIDVPWVYTDHIQSRNRMLDGDTLHLDLDDQYRAFRFHMSTVHDDDKGIVIIDDCGLHINSRTSTSFPLTVTGQLTSNSFLTNFIRDNGCNNAFVGMSLASGGNHAASNNQALLLYSGGQSEQEWRGIIQAIDTESSIPNRLDLNPDGGTIFANGVPLQTTSDRRLKTNITTIVDARNTITKLKPVLYDKLQNMNHTEVMRGSILTREAGLVAQDVYIDAPQLRHLVILPDDANIKENLKEADFWGSKPASLNYIGLIPYMIKMLQEQDAIITELQSSIKFRV